mmetsp:Transcript_15948/g.24683  ORF Transcript_15948/g.24683 Transcript_15948/m.24683 type:complete len:91 (-) Transcript_15948:639-911(-)
MRDVELWARALREEEKSAIEKYSREHGDKEMEQIRESIKQKYEKELKEKQALESAKPHFDAQITTMMEQRKVEWEENKKKFILLKMNELK